MLNVTGSVSTHSANYCRPTLTSGHYRSTKELQSYAPKVTVPYERAKVGFAFSNDASADCFYDQQKRIVTENYRTAQNRVALLVGESALLGALHYIPEETIIMLDYSSHTVKFMERYIEGLKNDNDIESWLRGVNSGVEGESLAADEELLRRQHSLWREGGHRHGLDSDDSFRLVQRTANKKTIIPWCADILNKDEMQDLGDALRSVNSIVTFMNATNVIEYTAPIYNGADQSLHQFVAGVGELPMVSDAPIVTTSLYARDYHPDFDESMRNPLQPTGPFFGIDDLLNNGGSIYDGEKRVVPTRAIYRPID